MHVINVNNIREALPLAFKYVLYNGKEEPSRNGPVLAAQEPVTIHYLQPKQHVLINPVRDANPFFHLMEAMWMLAGRDDGVFLDNYVKDFSKTYGTNGRIMDAYGFRWRHGLRYDQLTEIIRQLKENKATRQCVLQMWGAGQEDLISNVSKPCNLVVTFRVQDNRLHMAVVNRSNDLIWGCCGANAVHFPILQEYVAGMIGIEMGEYWQISTNLHLYTTHLDMIRERIGKAYWDHELIKLLANPGEYEATESLITHQSSFDTDLDKTMKCIEDMRQDGDGYAGDITNEFLRNTVVPMATAHMLHKKKEKKRALEEIENVQAEDWKRAGREWLERHNVGR